MISRVVSVKRQWRGRVAHLRCHLGEDPGRIQDHQRPSRLIRGHRPLNQFERGGFVTEAHMHRVKRQ